MHAVAPCTWWRPQLLLPLLLPLLLLALVGGVNSTVTVALAPAVNFSVTADFFTLTVTLNVSAPTPVWLGLAFGATSMYPARPVMAIPGGGVPCGQYVNAPSHAAPGAPLSGAAATGISACALATAGGVTTLSFSRSWDTGAPDDGPLAAGGTAAFVWAYGTSAALVAEAASGAYSLVLSPDCPAGQEFLSGACTPCSPGTRSDAGDNGCTVCHDGAWSPGAVVCVPCAPGSAARAGDAVCSSCAPGHASVTGATTCGACAPGTYAPSGGASNCTACPNGTAAGAHGAVSCGACVAGRFSAGGAAACSPCTCAPGTACSGGANVCGLCEKNTYCAGGPAVAASCTCTAGARAVPVPTYLILFGLISAIRDCAAHRSTVM